MKNRKISITIFIVFMLIITSLFSGCKKEEEATSTSGTTASTSSMAPAPSGMPPTPGMPGGMPGMPGGMPPTPGMPGGMPGGMSGYGQNNAAPAPGSDSPKLPAISFSDYNLASVPKLITNQTGQSFYIFKFTDEKGTLYTCRLPESEADAKWTQGEWLTTFKAYKMPTQDQLNKIASAIAKEKISNYPRISMSPASMQIPGFGMVKPVEVPLYGGNTMGGYGSGTPGMPGMSGYGGGMEDDYYGMPGGGGMGMGMPGGMPGMPGMGGMSGYGGLSMPMAMPGMPGF